MASARETVTGHAAWSVERPSGDRTTVVETTKEDERAKEAAKAPPPELVLDVERHMPDGAGPTATERLLMPWVVGVLAVLGVVVVGTVLGFSAGWRAAIIGIGWVLLAYLVSWIVVWGAGLLRAKEEREISEEIEEHLIEDPLPGPRP